MSTEALARRAVAWKEWRWISGMVNTGFGRCVDATDPYDMERDGDDVQLVRWTNRRGISDFVEPDGELPDLDDKPTLGAIAFGLLPEAWGHPGDVVNVRVVYGDGEWWLRVPGSEPGIMRTIALNIDDPDAFAEALVCALEKSPC